MKPPRPECTCLARKPRLAREAGVKKLVLVHIQPWSDKEATLAAAKAEFDGEIVVGCAKDVYEVL